jgi:hypothetical protein
MPGQSRVALKPSACESIHTRKPPQGGIRWSTNLTEWSLIFLFLPFHPSVHSGDDSILAKQFLENMDHREKKQTHRPPVKSIKMSSFIAPTSLFFFISITFSLSLFTSLFFNLLLPSFLSLLQSTAQCSSLYPLLFSVLPPLPTLCPPEVPTLAARVTPTVSPTRATPTSSSPFPTT